MNASGRILMANFKQAVTFSSGYPPIYAFHSLQDEIGGAHDYAHLHKQLYGFGKPEPPWCEWSGQ